MENLNTSYLSSDDSSKPSQPLSLNTNNAPRYNSFLRTQSPADEKSFKKKVLHHSQSTAITPVSSITSISSSVSLKPSLPPGGNTLSLNFSKKELTKLPRVILDYAPSLLVLDLSKNQFTNFPEELFKIQRLKTLKMESNYLKRIPNEIYQLSQLENLSFASNYIVSIPKTISKLAKTLQSLNVSNNHIEVLPKELTELVNLKALYIQRNFFTALPIQFDSLISLKELSLEWFKYTNPPLAVHQNDKNRSNIIKLFQLCKTLQSFSKTEVNFEDFINHFSLSNENIFAIRDPLNRNLLHITTIEQEIGIIHYLAANKPFFLHELDQDGQTPLNLAVREEKYFLARILLFHGADPNLGGGTVGSALHMVTIKHQLGMVRELLKHGANPKIGDLEGNTPLHLLFSTFSKDMNVSKDIAQALLDAGADPNQPNNDLWTPLHLAIRRGQTDCVKWVVQNNMNNKDKLDKIFDLDAKGGSDEWTPLHLASSLSQYEIMNILFDNEVKLMSRTKTGRTAREVSMNHPIIMKILNKMEQRWMENNIFKASVSSTKEDGNLKDITAISNIENIAPNRESVKRTEGKPKAHGSLSSTKSRSSKSIGFRPALSTQLSKGSLKLDMQAKLKRDLRDKRDRKNYEEESDFREKKDAFSRYGMDDVKDDSLIVGDIDEIVGPKEITRVMPKSPNNIQKLQIAQNYRNHLLSLLPEKDLSRENVTRENEPHYGSFAGSRTIDNGFATLTNKQKQKMDVASQHFLFPNEFSKYIRKFENYNDEIKVFQNNILKNDDFEMPLCEKLKFLFYMKIIHMKLNKKIGRLNSELIPFELFIICESIEDELKKTAFNIPKKGVSHNNQDIILRSLLFIFENLETKDSNRNIVIKATISQMFGEFKYNSARHFLQQLLENSQENKYLRKEARSSLKLLYGMATSQVLRNNFMKDKPASLMLGSPKNEFFSQPLTKIVKASFLSPTGTSTIATAVSKHKRPMSYYGKCENVGEEEEGLGHRKTMQQALQKKIIKESMDNEDIVNDSHESPIRTKTFPRPLAEKNSQIDRPRKIEIRGLAPKVGVDGYFSQF